jgi:hypothetical protein
MLIYYILIMKFSSFSHSQYKKEHPSDGRQMLSSTPTGVMLLAALTTRDFPGHGAPGLAELEGIDFLPLFLFASNAGFF